MLNNTSKVLITSGFLTLTVVKWWLGYEWLDVIGFSLLFVGVFSSKQDMIENNSEYGIYIYYTSMVFILTSLFIKWFVDLS